MAWDVTTEWDDIHRKLGNYEPLPEKKTEAECTHENIEKLEELTEKMKIKKAEERVKKTLNKSKNFFKNSSFERYNFNWIYFFIYFLELIKN